MKELGAYKTMFRLLDQRFNANQSEILGQLLSDLSLDIWADGTPGDPAIVGEWNSAVDAVGGTGEAIAEELRGYRTMLHFLENRCRIQPSIELSHLLDEMSRAIDGKASHYVLMNEWFKC